jgi:hypothetical protein
MLVWVPLVNTATATAAIPPELGLLNIMSKQAVSIENKSRALQAVWGMRKQADVACLTAATSCKCKQGNRAQLHVAAMGSAMLNAAKHEPQQGSS